MSMPDGRSTIMRWFLGCCATVGMVICVIVLFGGMVLWLLPLLMLVIAALIWRGRRGYAQLTLGYLNHAVRTGQPMVKVIQAASLDESPAMNKRLGRLAAGLRAGQPLWVALEESVPEFNARELNLIAAGQRTGRLGRTLARIAACPDERDLIDQREPGVGPGVAMMMLWLSAVAFGIGGFGLFAWLMPELEQVFADVEPPMPVGMTFPGSPVWHTAAALLGTIGWLAMLGVVFIFTGSRVATGRWSRAWGGWTDPLVWCMPFVGTAARARALADWCTALGQAIAAGLPMHRAATDAGECCTNRILAVRTVQMRRMLEAGVDLSEAARRAKMPRLIHGMLATARGRDGLARTLVFLADHYENQFGRVEALLRAAVIPMLVLVNALMIGLFAVWVVRCMVTLLEALMDQPTWGAL